MISGIRRHFSARSAFVIRPQLRPAGWDQIQAVLGDHCGRLHPGPGRHLHLPLPDELGPAGAAVPGALHAGADPGGGLDQGRPGRHVERGLAGESVK